MFDLIDESETMEVDGVAREDYGKVADHCYLCDLCYMTKCPYVPPHEWNVDFPHLMLRAKAQRFKQGKTPLRDKALTSTQAVGNLGRHSGGCRDSQCRQPLQARCARPWRKRPGIHADASAAGISLPVISQTSAGAGQ